MHFSALELALTASILGLVAAQPTGHGRKHRRQDYNNPALYANVDWATVNYGGPAATPAPKPSPSPAAAQAAPAAPEKVEDQPAPAQSSKAPSTGSSGSSGGKRGLAYNPGGPSLDLFDGSSSISWAYDWDSSPGSIPSKYDFVPLLMSGESMHTDQWATNVKTATGSTKYLMSFNEPDMTTAVGGSQMSVGSAVSAFKQYMSPYASQGYKLGSPAVSNGQGTNSATGQPEGLDWLKPFLQQCSGCPISFAPVHWYGCSNGCPVQNDIDSFKSTVQAAMSATNMPVWVTEFQCLGDAETFLSEVLPWLDSQQGVERYSYFMVKDGILTNGGALSQIGQKYAS